MACSCATPLLFVDYMVQNTMKVSRCQGFYITKILPSRQFRRFLRSWRRVPEMVYCSQKKLCVQPKSETKVLFPPYRTSDGAWQCQRNLNFARLRMTIWYSDTEEKRHTFLPLLILLQ